MQEEGGPHTSLDPKYQTNQLRSPCGQMVQGVQCADVPIESDPLKVVKAQPTLLPSCIMDTCVTCLALPLCSACCVRVLS